MKGRPSTFIMRVSDDETDDLDDSDEEATSGSLVTRKKFNFNHLYVRYSCAVLLSLIYLWTYSNGSKFIWQ